MADEETSNYHWRKPQVGASADQWGGKWNDNADDMDTALKMVEDKADARLVRTNNLSDLTNAATARTNLGLGTAATQATSFFDLAGAAGTVSTQSCQRASNLSDVTNAATARGNLGLRTAATRNITVSTSGPSGGSSGDIWVQI
jgi:hypothetical protein